MADYETKITTAMLAKLAAAGAGNNLLLTHIAVGSNDTIPDTAAAGLVAPEYESSINNKGHVEDSGNFWTDILIPPETGDFYIREVGLFGRLKNEPETTKELLAVARVAETYKPLLASGSNKYIGIKMEMSVTQSDAENINFTIDPSVVIATVQYVQENYVSQLALLDHAVNANRMILENAENIGMIKTLL